MMNLQELNAVKGLMHYLAESTKDGDLAFNVEIVDPYGETLGRIQRVGGADYQFFAPGETIE